MKKLTCHCSAVEIHVKLPEKGFEKLVRCNCSICKRKGLYNDTNRAREF